MESEWTGRRSYPARLVATAAVLLAVGMVAAGCDDGGAEADAGSASDRSDTTAPVPDAGDSDRTRRAYGLPFPPKVRGVRRRESGVEVTTRMDLDTLEEFYKSRLVDFEILRPEPNKLRVIGLREFMPAIRGHRYGPKTTLYYSGTPDRPSADAGVAREESDDDTGIGRPSVGAANSDRESTRETGAPVRLKTEDGELLAPDARWGEPYTPPEGSPLHQPEYRENFGSPIGEWKYP